MKMLARAGLALSAVLASGVARAATVTLPNCLNTPSIYTPCFGMVAVDPTTGNPIPWSQVGSGGGSGGGGAVTAAPNSYAAGSIVDLGTGATPAANTVNANLGTINSTLGGLLKAGQSVNVGSITSPIVLAAGSATIGAVTQSGTWNIGTLASITNPVGLAAGSQVIGSIANTSFGATQSGAWTVGISGTVPVSGTFWQATQPISAASLPNPTGAPTATVQSQQLTAEQTTATNSATQATAAKQDTGNGYLATIAGAAGGSLDQANTLAGRGFSWGTGSQTVPQNNYINYVFSNPAGSGKTDYIIFREFGNGSTTVLTAMLRTNCTTPTGSTSTAGGNRLMGSSTTTASTLSYQIGTTAVTTGTAGPSELLTINGLPTDVTLLRIVPPGQSFCYAVSGLTGAFAASVQISFSVAGWEQ